jgi:ATP-dependent DNA helicase RecG
MITTTIEQLNRLMNRLEDCHLEFKAAQNSFDRSRDLPDYCAALANEGGGRLILGVKEKSDKKGEIIGTQAFKSTHNKLSNELLNILGIRVDVEEIIHPNGRVLIFHVPSRPIGSIIHSKGNYYIPMRAGESLREMDDQTLKSILNESEPDFSMTIIPELSLGDLESKALNIFKEKWAQKSKREDYLFFSNEKVLQSVGILTDKGLNFAGLILFGKKEKLDELLPDSEIIFEWRQNSTNIAHDYRVSWREPLFVIFDSIWETVNARNSRIPFQQGFIQREIIAFNEKSIREAVLNAVTHRDYTCKGQSIFIKASPDEFVISSPGGFPAGITIENILYKSSWRNRRIAEIFEKAGLVERSGQGMDDIFQSTIRDGKGKPDLSKSDSYSVVLSIPARIKDIEFVSFLEKITNELQIGFTIEEMLELETIREKQKTSKLEFRNKFKQLGIVEQIGSRGKSVRYILSHRYYSHRGKTGVHTRLMGISRDKQKVLILNHFSRNPKGYMKDFADIFPELKQMDISNLLRELKDIGMIRHCGPKKFGYWELVNKNADKKQIE